MKQEALQDSDGNEGKDPPGKDPPKSIICSSPNSYDEEDLLKLKDATTTILEEMECKTIGCSSIEVDEHDFCDLKEKVMEALEKYQKSMMILKQFLKK